MHAEPTLFQKLRYTPLTDALCGRLSTRLNWRAGLSESGLPEPVQSLIIRITRKSKLWRTEKADIASELVAHFSDAIEAGSTPENAIQRFGDEKTAIRLLRRAKKRNRHWMWHASRQFCNFVWVLVGIYLLLAVYFFLGKPSIKTNYIAEMNNGLSNVPQTDLAWPIYRKAILNVRSQFTLDQNSPYLFDARPGDKRWEELATWLHSHASDVETIRQAASKPVFGFRYEHEGSAPDKELYSKSPFVGEASGLVVTLPMMQLNDMRQLAVVVAADARLARTQSDAFRFLLDIRTLSAISNHVSGEFIIERMMSQGILAMAYHEIEECLLHSPQVLSAKDLGGLAHMIADPKTAADLVNFEGERRVFDDLMQRVYTDDGNGDGRLTLEGVRLLQRVMRSASAYDTSDVAVVVTPALLPMLASRKEITQEYDRLLHICQANLSKPWREADYRPVEERINQIKSSELLRVRYMVLGWMFPGISYVQPSAERVLAKRDAMQTGIALELYRRQHGSYPQTLMALSPGLLPKVPVDPVDGQPLRYRVVQGNPKVYSVGADRDDDGGKIVLRPSGDPDYRVTMWEREPRKDVDGDWVLYPEPQPTRE